MKISSLSNCLSVENAKISDKAFADKAMDNIQSGELILRDLGYYSINSYTSIEQRQAFYVSRLKPQISIYQKDVSGNYKVLHLKTLLEIIKTSKNIRYASYWDNLNK